MEWYEDPTRAQDEVRRAYWRGAWRMLGTQLAILIPVAILYPVFGQHRFSGADKLDSRSIAGAIQAVHRDTRRWPTLFGPVRERLHRTRSIYHATSFLPLDIQATQATYAISVNGRVCVWRIDDRDVQPVGGKAIFGIINPGGARF